MPVTYAEIAGWPKESREYGKFSAERKLKCAWTDRNTLMLDMLAVPGALYEPNTATGARCMSASCEPLSLKQLSVGTVGVYEDAIVTLHYRTLEPGDPQGSGQNIISESIEPTAQFLTLDHTKFRWGSASGAPLLQAEAPGRIEVGFDYVYTRYSLAAIPAAALSMLLTPTNGGVVTATLLGLTFAAETLLYNPPRISREIDAAGNGLFTLQYRFTYKPSGWNKYWNNESQNYQSIYLSSGLEFKQFPLGNFLLL